MSKKFQWFPHYEQTLKEKISSASLDNGDYRYCDI